jgi:hypothetical protein
MKRVASSAILILLVACNVLAQSAPDAAELTRLLNEFLAGASSGDATIHERFWADDLIYTRSAGRRVNKAEVLRELAELAEARSGDVPLRRWALARALELEPGATELAGVLATLEEEARAEDRKLAAEDRLLEDLDGDERVPTLRRLAAALQGRPDRAEQYCVVLWELFTRRPDELRWRRLLERLLARQGDFDGLTRLWTRDLVSAADDNRAT